MSKNLFQLDINQPAFTGSSNLADRVETIQSYLFQLLENLRYTLRNLDAGNMNQTALSDFTGNITEPIYARIENTEGSVTQLTLTAEGLTTRVNDAEGNISMLQQTVNGFTLVVSNGSTSSILQLKSGSTLLSSATITFNGFVTFTNLAQTNSATVINGGNITTGTISAITLSGNTIIGGTITGATLRSVSSQDNGFEIYYGSVSSSLLVGGMRFDANGAGSSIESKYRMYIYTNPGWAMKIIAHVGLSLEAENLIYLHSLKNITLLGNTSTGTIGLQAAVIALYGTLTINGYAFETYVRAMVAAILAGLL